jgi:hypothetical protein
VPWRWVIAGLLVLVAIVWIMRVLRRRRARPVEAPVVVKDPATLALEALAALRGLKLPEHGRFGEHALHLTRIVRRWLEATQGTPRPGDTTRELVARLATASLPPEELGSLAALLAAFDRVKFARAPSSVDEAHRAEQAVESLVRRTSGPGATPASPAPPRAA